MEKICFIIPSLKTGGGNRVFIELANELTKQNCEVEVIYPVNSTEKITFAISAAVTTIPIGRIQRNHLGKIWNLVSLFLFVLRKKRKYKVVISDPFLAIIFMFFPSKNLLRYLQGDDYGMFDDRFLIKNSLVLSVYKRLIVLSYRKKVKYLFNSDHSFKQFVIHSKRNDVEKIIIHPGLNHLFRDQNIRRWDSKVSISVMARKHPLKGFADFIKAWTAVKNELLDHIGTIYVISHDDLNTFDISDFTLVTPKSDEDITGTLNQTHLFISTSWNEGFGLPPLEAMACGCACVISNSGGVLEYAKDRENCLMYPPRNVEALISVISESVQSRTLLQQLGREGKLTAKQFSLEKAATDFFNYITETKTAHAS